VGRRAEQELGKSRQLTVRGGKEAREEKKIAEEEEEEEEELRL